MNVRSGRARQVLFLAAVTCAVLWLFSSINMAREARTRPVDGDSHVDLRPDPAYPVDALPVQPGTRLSHVDGPPAGIDAKAVDALETDAEERLSILVYFKPELSRLSAERTAVKTLASERGGFVRYEYKAAMPHVINLRNVPRSAIDAILAMSGVTRIEEDLYHADLVRLDEATPVVRGLQSQITGAGLVADGTGVRVCVADTGIDMDHVMYSNRIDTAASFDFANNDSNPDDDHGHGSHVAGIAVGAAGLSVDFGCEGSEPFQGMAPNATLIGAKILNSAGGGTDSDIIAGIDHCADQSASGGRADVINLSIGTGVFTSGACTHSWAVASNNAVANGVVVVAASGNENNSNSMGSPACGADVIAVGATYKDDYPNCEDGTSTFNWGVCSDNSPARDDIVCFSNESDFLDVAAPGSVIWSASNAAGGGSIAGQSGTSMASPMVAGLAALILDADSSLTPAQVRQIIRDGAVDMGPAGFDRAYGWGRADAINSLNLVVPCGTDPDCDDGLFCNGAETCNAGSCQAGVAPCVGGTCDEATDTCSTVAFEWTMDTDPGWTLEGDWAYGQPTGGGGQHGGPDPTGAATGNSVVGFALGGDYANNLPETHLTSTPINCSGLTNVTLRFQRWLGVEQPLYDHAYVRVSNDGTSWTTVWENTVEIADNSWNQQEFDISSVADNQSTVYLRWTQGTTDSSWQYCGWNIDDVQILATGSSGPSCTDGIQNQGEDRIDCGGPCAACACTSDAACDNGLFCDGTESCDGFGSCQVGTSVSCDDGVGCTADSCNAGTDSCDNTPNDGSCDDGAFCNGNETCDVALDCQAGTAVSCNDGVGCTDDSCNEATDSCDSTPNNSNCDNGLFCDGSEICDAGLDCQSGGPVGCDDGVGCTTDFCNEGTDSCDNTPNDGVCSDGLFCNGAEVCDSELDCQVGGDPCPGETCDEGTDTCVACTVDNDCDDGLFCNGAETCSAGSCQAGTPVGCDDGVGCTADSCNEATDSCDSPANDAACDDGLFCNGSETCDAVLDCQAGSAVSCDDGVGCTADSCDEGTDSCDNAPDNGLCDDGAFCNGAEICDPALDCQAGSDPCGGGTCDEVDDVCDSGNALLWMTFRSNTSVPGVGTVTDDDIVTYDPQTGLWEKVFDGSDVGLSGLEINGLAVLPSGDLLMSFTVAGSVAGLIGGPSGDSIDDSDIVQFTPTSLGTTTSGTFTFYLDGSDVSLSSNGEDIDAIVLLADGRIAVSTTGSFSGSGASGADEDLFLFTATALGASTSGSFELYFDGSDVALNSSSSEDVDAATLTAAGDILFSTSGSFSVSGASGSDEDVADFTPATLGSSTSGTFALLLDLSALGISTSEDIGSMHIAE